MKKFLCFDTCALISLDFMKMLDNEDTIGLISDVTYKELEDIKTSGRKDESTKYGARVARNLIDKNSNKFIIVHYKRNYGFTLWRKMLTNSNDNKILVSIWKYLKRHHIKNYEFITCDGLCKDHAKVFFKMNAVMGKNNPTDTYTGFKEVYLDDNQLAQFYQYTFPANTNKYDLIENQYLIIKDIDGKVTDKYKWVNNEYQALKYYTFTSKMFGEVKPFKEDIYQQIAMDSLATNQISMLGGPAGSGKTFLSLAYLMAQLDAGEIDKIVIFCNPVAARNAGKLGFYPGTALEKMMSTQVGHVLGSKLGDNYEVERLIEENRLDIIPAADARGYEIPPHCGVYILESQNLTSDLLRMLLQRVSEDAKVIVDGDRKEQTDMAIYETDNGMKEMVRVFKGESIYSQVDLQNIYRSKIASIAEKMK